VNLRKISLTKEWLGEKAASQLEPALAIHYPLDAG
jgi:hypothetical protein